MCRAERLAVVALALMLAFAMPAFSAQKKEQGKQAQTAKVNINSATVEQLMTLPGIGQVTAQRIVEHRAKNGPFKRIEDLMSVKGIGEKKFQRLKDRITVE